VLRIRRRLKDNIICGRAGNDIIYGNDGNDSLYGGEGDDTQRGNDGDDFLKSTDHVGANDLDDGGNNDDVCVVDQGDSTTSCETVEWHPTS
jgi:Ca2+-binding RTX toxin-like protein